MVRMRITLVAAIVAFLIPSLTFSAPPTTNTSSTTRSSTTADSTIDRQIHGNGEKPGESWVSAFVIAVLTTIVGPIVVYYVTNQKGIREVNKLRKGITLPQPAANGGHRSSVMVFGIGGSGKSSLIENMFGTGAKTLEKTDKVWFYEYSDQLKDRRIDGDRAKSLQSFTHYISDYKGQNLGTIVQTFILQQKREYSPMAYGHITAAIFVVDLFETHEKTGVPQETDDQGVSHPLVDLSLPSPSRIKANNDAWNDQALDAIFGMLTSDTLRCVIVFINKFNALNPRTPNSDMQSLAGYQRLTESIKRRAGASRQFLVVKGSGGDIRADDGTVLHSGGEGTGQIKGLLRDAADDPDGD